MRRTPHGFTLVELLLVVTIIAVLMAMLMPALHKAVYHAELAVCAGNQHGLGGGVTAYAMQFNRAYPYRRAVREAANHISIVSGGPNWDSRPLLRPYLSLSGGLTCALIPGLDIEGSRPGTAVYSTFNLRFGFGYAGYKGMFRLGDRWEWDAAPDNYYWKGTTLAETRYTSQAGTMYGSHPAETYSLLSGQDEHLGGTSVPGLATVGGADYTYGYWRSTDVGRGLVDLNTLYADLSVLRLYQVDWDGDERVARTPGAADGGPDPNAYPEWVPKQ